MITNVRPSTSTPAIKPFEVSFVHVASHGSGNCRECVDQLVDGCTRGQPEREWVISWLLLSHPCPDVLFVRIAFWSGICSFLSSYRWRLNKGVRDLLSHSKDGRVVCTAHCKVLKSQSADALCATARLKVDFLVGFWWRTFFQRYIHFYTSRALKHITKWAFHIETHTTGPSCMVCQLFADTHTKTTTTKNDDGSMQTKKETSVDSTTHASTATPAKTTTKKTTKKSM